MKVSGAGYHNLNAFEEAAVAAAAKAEREHPEFIKNSEAAGPSIVTEDDGSQTVNYRGRSYHVPAEPAGVKLTKVMEVLRDGSLRVRTSAGYDLMIPAKWDGKTNLIAIYPPTDPRANTIRVNGTWINLNAGISAAPVTAVIGVDGAGNIKLRAANGDILIMPANWDGQTKFVVYRDKQTLLYTAQGWINVAPGLDAGIRVERVIQTLPDGTQRVRTTGGYDVMIPPNWDGSSPFVAIYPPGSGEKANTQWIKVTGQWKPVEAGLDAGTTVAAVLGVDKDGNIELRAANGDTLIVPANWDGQTKFVVYRDKQTLLYTAQGWINVAPGLDKGIRLERVIQTLPDGTQRVRTSGGYDVMIPPHWDGKTPFVAIYPPGSGEKANTQWIKVGGQWKPVEAGLDAGTTVAAVLGVDKDGNIKLRATNGDVLIMPANWDGQTKFVVSRDKQILVNTPQGWVNVAPGLDKGTTGVSVTYDPEGNTALTLSDGSTAWLPKDWDGKSSFVLTKADGTSWAKLDGKWTNISAGSKDIIVSVVTLPDGSARARTVTGELLVIPRDWDGKTPFAPDLAASGKNVGRNSDGRQFALIGGKTVDVTTGLDPGIRLERVIQTLPDGTQRVRTSGGYDVMIPPNWDGKTPFVAIYPPGSGEKANTQWVKVGGNWLNVTDGMSDGVLVTRVVGVDSKGNIEVATDKGYSLIVPAHWDKKAKFEVKAASRTGDNYIDPVTGRLYVKLNGRWVDTTQGLPKAQDPYAGATASLGKERSHDASWRDTVTSVKRVEGGWEATTIGGQILLIPDDWDGKTPFNPKFSLGPPSVSVGQTHRWDGVGRDVDLQKLMPAHVTIAGVKGDYILGSDGQLYRVRYEGPIGGENNTNLWIENVTGFALTPEAMAAVRNGSASIVAVYSDGTVAVQSKSKSNSDSYEVHYYIGGKENPDFAPQANVQIYRFDGRQDPQYTMRSNTQPDLNLSGELARMRGAPTVKEITAAPASDETYSDYVLGSNGHVYGVRREPDGQGHRLDDITAAHLNAATLAAVENGTAYVSFVSMVDGGLAVGVTTRDSDSVQATVYFRNGKTSSDVHPDANGTARFTPPLPAGVKEIMAPAGSLGRHAPDHQASSPQGDFIWGDGRVYTRVGHDIELAPVLLIDKDGQPSSEAIARVLPGGFVLSTSGHVYKIDKGGSYTEGFVPAKLQNLPPEQQALLLNGEGQIIASGENRIAIEYGSAPNGQKNIVVLELQADGTWTTTKVATTGQLRTEFRLTMMPQNMADQKTSEYRTELQDRIRDLRTALKDSSIDSSDVAHPGNNSTEAKSAIVGELTRQVSRLNDVVVNGLAMIGAYDDLIRSGATPAEAAAAIEAAFGGEAAATEALGENWKADPRGALLEYVKGAIHEGVELLTKWVQSQLSRLHQIEDYEAKTDFLFVLSFIFAVAAGGLNVVAGGAALIGSSIAIPAARAEARIAHDARSGGRTERDSETSSGTPVEPGTPRAPQSPGMTAGQKTAWAGAIANFGYEVANMSGTVAPILAYYRFKEPKGDIDPLRGQFPSSLPNSETARLDYALLQVIIHIGPTLKYQQQGDRGATYIYPAGVKHYFFMKYGVRIDDVPKRETWDDATIQKDLHMDANWTQVPSVWQKKYKMPGRGTEGYYYWEDQFGNSTTNDPTKT